MGNTTSCTPSIISGGVVKVVFIDGRLEVYTKPIKAAELMLDHPQQFVCDSGDLKVGYPIQGLAADEELKRRRRLYVLLPMEMLYSILTKEDMGLLSYKATKAIKHGSFKHIGRIFPAFSDFCMFPSEVKMPASPERNKKPSERYSRQRSWRPALDTIVETPCKL